MALKRKMYGKECDIKINPLIEKWFAGAFTFSSVKVYMIELKLNWYTIACGGGVVGFFFCWPFFSFLVWFLEMWAPYREL